LLLHEADSGALSVGRQSLRNLSELLHDKPVVGGLDVEAANPVERNPARGTYLYFELKSCDNGILTVATVDHHTFLVVSGTCVAHEQSEQWGRLANAFPLNPDPALSAKQTALSCPLFVIPLASSLDVKRTHRSIKPNDSKCDSCRRMPLSAMTAPFWLSPIASTKAAIGGNLITSLREIPWMSS
jgi:hypothetical protein